MCGITGILFLKDNLKYKSIINNILNLQYNRGPDFNSLYQNNNIILGHNRLSILDLSPLGNQPMETNEGVICYNGEIYNFLDLKNDILKEKPNFKFNGSSDTEILTNYISIFGMEETLNKINGIYAFAYYDKVNKKIHLVRDRLGIKPLYYTFIDDALIFASNLSALFLSVKSYLNTDLEINYDAIYKYLLTNGMFEGETIVKNFYKLDSAGHLIYDLENIKKEIYWTPSIRNDDINKLIKNSIEINKIADVPVCIFFSGGVDSSILGYYCENYNGIHLCTDETIYAEKIAKKLNINLVKLEDDNYNKDELENLVKEYIKFSGEPSMACMIPMIVSKHIKDKYKVVLSGNGGDELFYGYERTPVINSKDELSRYIESKHRLLLDNNNYEFDDYHLLHTFRHPENFEMNYVKNYNFKEFKEFIHSSYKLNEDFEKESNYRWIELCTYVRNDLNPTLDFSTMYYSIEARVPLLDYRLIERCLTLTSNDHIDNDSKYYKDTDNRKIILKNILKNKLDTNLYNRNKRGFSLPNKLANEYSKLGEGSINKLKSRGIIKSTNFKKGLVGRDLIYFKNSCHALELWFQQYVDTNIINDNSNLLFSRSKSFSKSFNVEYYSSYILDIKLNNIANKDINIVVESIGDSKKGMFWEEHFNNKISYFDKSIKIPIINKLSNEIRLQIINNSNDNKLVELQSIEIKNYDDLQNLYSQNLSNRLLNKYNKDLINYKNILKGYKLQYNQNIQITHNTDALYNFSHHGYNSLELKSSHNIKLSTQINLDSNRFYLVSLTGFSLENNSTSRLYISSNEYKGYTKNLSRSIGNTSLIVDSNKFKNCEIGIEQKKNGSDQECIYISKLFHNQISYEDNFHEYNLITPKKNYEIACVIAFKDRQLILSKLIKIINKSDKDLCIILVCSNSYDYEFCLTLNKLYDNVYLYFTDNNFVGSKWQIGFLYAKLFNPKYVMITGSDDLIYPEFFNRLYNYTKDNKLDVCGVRSWQIFDQKSVSMYNCQYTKSYGNNELILGAGRIYSSRILDVINWNVHETLRNSCLDDLGYYMSKIHGAKIGILKNGEGLISYKGDWASMNPLSKIIEASKAKNSTIKIEKIKGREDYEKLLNYLNS